jgi:hypothetical protein
MTSRAVTPRQLLGSRGSNRQLVRGYQPRPSNPVTDGALRPRRTCTFASAAQGVLKHPSTRQRTHGNRPRHPRWDEWTAMLFSHWGVAGTHPTPTDLTKECRNSEGESRYITETASRCAAAADSTAADTRSPTPMCRATTRPSHTQHVTSVPLSTRLESQVGGIQLSCRTAQLQRPHNSDAPSPCMPCWTSYFPKHGTRHPNLSKTQHTRQRIIGNDMSAPPFFDAGSHITHRAYC